MSREPQKNDRYLDLRASQPADKSFLGGISLGSRSFIFFLLGVVTIGLIAGLFYQTDQRLSVSLDVLKNAQKASLSVNNLGRAIENVRANDASVRANDDPAAPQIHRRAVDQVIAALNGLQNGLPKNSSTDQLNGAIGTIRDGFSGYGLEISAMLDDRNILGLSRDTGLRGKRRDAAMAIQSVLNGLEDQELISDFAAIDRRADQVPALSSQQDRTDTRAAYIDYARKLESLVDDTVIRANLTTLLQKHSAIAKSQIDIAEKLQTPPQAIEDILDYIAPSLRQINDYGEQLARVSPVTYERDYQAARKNLVIGSAALIVVFVLIGLALMRSITGPVTRLSEAVVRLISGERAIGIPLQGNTDAIGDMARALDKWLDSLAEIDHLRTQLDDARMRITLGAIAEGVENPPVINDDGDNDGDNDGDDSGVATSREHQGMQSLPPEKPFLALQPQKPEAVPLLDFTRHARTSEDAGTIGYATRQLNQFNNTVTLAAKDVERTELLINLLGDATQQISALEINISSIREESNLLVFNAITPSNSVSEKPLIDLSDDANDPSASNMSSSQNDGRRFESLRAKVGSAEEMLDGMHSTLEHISSVAHAIATQASEEALEATGKLMSQSERLQSMLDELINKVGPNQK